MNKIRDLIFRLETAIVFIPVVLILTWPGLISNFLNSTLMPHGHCYLWDPSLVWLHFSSDLLIGISYLAISIGIGVLVFRARKDIPFHGMFIAFGLFILACGFTHLMEVYTIWESTYWLSGSIKLITAVASAATAIAVPIFVPKALQLVKEAKLSGERKENIEAANKELRAARQMLQRELASKTADINTLIEELTHRKNVIEQSLYEKEIMLKEIHHRVKNNLQIITSLLSLQITKLKDKLNGEILNVSINRIRAMAMIHEKLYHTELLSMVNFGSYLNELVHAILNSYNVDQSKVKLDIAYEDITVDIDTAIPLALIVNELITNSIKYAFDDGEGMITIKLNRIDDSEIKLIVADNGRGIPEQDNTTEPETLGLLLVSSLATQLKASMQLNTKGGTEFVFRFSI